MDKRKENLVILALIVIGLWLMFNLASYQSTYERSESKCRTTDTTETTINHKDIIWWFLITNY